MPFQTKGFKRGYVYIISNIKRTVLYIGVTANLEKRIWEHKNNQGSKFPKKYNLHYLLYYEEHQTIKTAIEREKQLKNWHREWKLNLIKEQNPELKDLSDNLFSWD